jgi:hypothetical protein
MDRTDRRPHFLSHKLDGVISHLWIQRKTDQRRGQALDHRKVAPLMSHVAICWLQVQGRSVKQRAADASLQQTFAHSVASLDTHNVAPEDVPETGRRCRYTDVCPIEQSRVLGGQTLTTHDPPTDVREFGPQNGRLQDVEMQVKSLHQ